MEEKLLNNDVKQFVAFKVGDQEYGADIHKVSIIEKTLNYARVPTAPDYIKGVVNLRGEIVTVMSLRLKFGLPEIEEDDETRTIIFKFNEVLLGIIVDSVDEVVTLKESDIESVTQITNDRSLDYILGIAKAGGRLITLLNIERLITELLEK
ncbi:MAG TPA: chemotaxis protein CheW [Clostridiaceae bacterium]|jgi:purine-binding chemotaxis protein CheW|nr:chemotaxis protein CheW [Clostridiaceae bacterium]